MKYKAFEIRCVNNMVVVPCNEQPCLAALAIVRLMIEDFRIGVRIELRDFLLGFLI